MADWPDSSPSIDGITNATSPSDATVGGPAKISELAGEVTAIGGDLFTAKATNGGYASFTALVSALWSAISGKASSSHDHDGTYSAAGHNHSGTYDPAGSAASAQAAAVQRANHTGTQLASTISDFNTAVRTNRLDQLATPTASVAMGSQKITGLGTPTASTDAVTKAYADALAGGSSSFGNNFVHVDDYGAVADGATNYCGTVTNGSTTFSALGMPNYPDKPFRASDVGKTIRIGSLNFVAAAFTTTIAAVASDGGSCTLAAPCNFSSSLAVAEWGGTDSRTAIQAAIDDADGRIVLLGPGVYTITGSLTLREGTKIQGTGNAQSVGYQSSLLTSIQTPNKSAIMLRPGVDANVFVTDGTSQTNGVGIADVFLRGSCTSSTACAVIASVHPTALATNWYLRNVLMDGGYNSMVFVACTQAWVENCVFFFTKSNAVELVYSPDNWFVNCGFGSDVTGTNAAMTVDANSGNGHYYGNAFQFSRYGMTVASSGNVISHNRFTDNYYAGLVLSGSENVVTGNLVTSIPGGTWPNPYGGGAGAGYYITGDRNTLTGNGAVPRGTVYMTHGTRLTGAATGNKVVTGATNATSGNLNDASGSNTFS